MALETPLSGRFLKEGRILFFGPPIAYLNLCWATLATGAVMIVMGILQTFMRTGEPFFWGFVGVMVFLAGLWAFGSLQRITFDLKNRSYRRWHGPGLLPRLYTGSTESLQAMVLMAEDRHLPMGRYVVYRLVLYWKNPREPLMVVQQMPIKVPVGAPIRYGVQAIGSQGWEFARALGVNWQDLADRSSPCPIPVFS